MTLLRHLVALFVISLLNTQSQASQPSYELALRARDTVELMANSANQITLQIEKLFLVGFGQAANPHATTNLKAHLQLYQLLLSSISTLPLISTTRVLAQGMFVSLSREEQVVMTTASFGLGEGNCSTAFPLICIHSYTTHPQTGAPLSFVRTQVANASEIFPEFQHTTTTTKTHTLPSAPQTIPTTQGLIEHVALLRNKTDALIGFVGVGTTFAALDAKLNQLQTSDTTTVFVVDFDSNIVVGTSGKIQDCYDSHSQNGSFRLAVSQSCVAQVSEFGSMAPSNAAEPFLVRGDQYGISLSFSLLGLPVRVIQVSKLNPVVRDISPDSPSYIALATVTSLMLVISLLLIGCVIWYRHLHLWRVAQPLLLIIFLVGCVASQVLVLTSAGAPTAALCASRQVLLCMSLTLGVSALLAKLTRVHFQLNNPKTRDHINTNSGSARSVLWVVVVATSLQALMMIIFELAPPPPPTRNFSVANGEVDVYDECPRSAGYLLERGLLVILLLLACYFSYKTRNLSPMFAESRALMTVSFHTLILIVALLFLSLASSASYQTAVVQGAVGILWGTMSAQMAIFSPRIARQLARGDLTTVEVKQLMVQHLKAVHRSMEASQFEKHAQNSIL